MEDRMCLIKADKYYFKKERENLLTDSKYLATKIPYSKAILVINSISADIIRRNNKVFEIKIIYDTSFRFEIGKYYENTDGFKVHILGVHHLLLYGKCYIAETNGEIPIIPLGMFEESTEGFREITKEDWLKDFKPINEDKNNG